uniref:Uncharacterized protein n=1 Tax=uncultured marine thaumarchaeote SAT1000_22_D06 TaxID=1456395 RepID=A0A075I803_9ARCH|nr:hypothetical protein [uncultured marine thaumarchaeote SAT1000_22_D06]
MKVFQIRSSIILILSFSLIGSGILVPNSSAQDAQIPGWIKNVADWWASGDISENEFLTGIEYLINNNIISLPSISCNEKIESQTTSSAEMIPDWIKNNASWWSDNLIDDIDFINGLQYLIKHKIIKIDNKKILGQVPLEDIRFSPSWQVDKDHLVFVQSSFFEAYGVYGHCLTEGDNQVWGSLMLGLNPNKLDMYNEVAVWNDPQKTVVVYPYFTFVAYTEPGFYTYYRGECDSCTTTKFASANLFYNEYQSSGIGHQALTLLGYTSISDMEIDQNPGILQQFDKVIILHNEYVTRAMFDAITSHPNVIYLYPNALYAEIEVDYVDETITLIRGHNYPEPEIINGFDWEFDNTYPYEYDNLCLDMEFYQIKNGWMTTCYPENIFLQNTKSLFNLLKLVKDL